jgi:hypothetical protein
LVQRRLSVRCHLLREGWSMVRHRWAVRRPLQQSRRCEAHHLRL